MWALPAAGLSDHTAQALATKAGIRCPNARLGAQNMKVAELTHPDYATLVDPLSAFGGKRGFLFCFSLHPLCAAERVDQRSVVGVSKICGRQ